MQNTQGFMQNTQGFTKQLGIHAKHIGIIYVKYLCLRIKNSFKKKKTSKLKHSSNNKKNLYLNVIRYLAANNKTPTIYKKYNIVLFLMN